MPALASVARIVFVAALVFIVGNALADSIADEQWGWGVAEVLAFPLTFLLHPVLAGEGASAWPLADRVALPVALAVALLAYAFLFQRDRRLHQDSAGIS
jgi:hypothetical protein